MTPQEFNEKVNTKIVVTVPLTITAFTSADSQLSALRFVLKKLDEALKDQGLEVSEWYRWSDIWITDLSVGKVDCSPAQRVQKMEVPIEAEVTEEA